MLLAAPQPRPDNPKQALKGKYDDALIKSLNDYFIKLKNDRPREFFSVVVLERPAEFISTYIQRLVTFENFVQTTSSLDNTLSNLDRLVAAVGHEKISDQLNILQLVNCTRILEYLKLPEFSKRNIKSVEDFILLVEDRKQGKIDSDKFSREATTYIQQMRQVIPRQSLAWLLLDKIAV